jgi:hypothetical protein
VSQWPIATEEDGDLKATRIPAMSRIDSPSEISGERTGAGHTGDRPRSIVYFSRRFCDQPVEESSPLTGIFVALVVSLLAALVLAAC